MTNRDSHHMNNGLRRAIGPRALRDTLSAGEPMAVNGGRRDRFQFRCLKRLCLPRPDLSPRFAPN